MQLMVITLFAILDMLYRVRFITYPSGDMVGRIHIATQERECNITDNIDDDLCVKTMFCVHMHVLNMTEGSTEPISIMRSTLILDFNWPNLSLYSLQYQFKGMKEVIILLCKAIRLIWLPLYLKLHN